MLRHHAQDHRAKEEEALPRNRVLHLSHALYHANKSPQAGRPLVPAPHLRIDMWTSSGYHCRVQEHEGEEEVL